MDKGREKCYSSFVVKKKVLYLVVGVLALYGGLAVLGRFGTLGSLGSLGFRQRGMGEIGVIGEDRGVGGVGRGIVEEKIALAPRQTGMIEPVAPVANDEVEERLVIRNGTIRAVVADVKSEKDALVDKVKELGGFVVDARLSQPEEAPHLSMSVRVPAGQLDALMGFVKERAERVTYEATTADDVTDQYIDEQARLKSLEETRAQMSTILEKAVEISDLLQIQREITRVDQQIESAKGRIEYLEKSAALSLLEIELAQSEFELSYTPTEKWRPAFVFKQAVRSLLSTLQGLSYTGIRLAVYAVIWLPGVLLARFVWRRLRKKS